MATHARYYLPKAYPIYVLLFACIYSVSCRATLITAEVRPVRIIYINYADEITAIHSNTDMAVQPSVVKVGAPHIQADLNMPIRNEYETLLRKHDFSEPTSITIKDVGWFDMILNVIFNNVFAR